MHELQGTNEPIWAIKTIKAVCLQYVDLPPILGPVIMSMLSFSSNRRRCTKAPGGSTFQVPMPAVFNVYTAVFCQPDVVDLLFRQGLGTHLVEQAQRLFAGAFLYGIPRNRAVRKTTCTLL